MLEAVWCMMDRSPMRRSQTAASKHGAMESLLVTDLVWVARESAQMLVVPFSGVRGLTKPLMLFEIERLVQWLTLMVNESESKLQVLSSSLVVL